MLIRADLHCHSAASMDGRSTLKQLAEAAKQAGIQALAISDHDGCTAVEGDFPVLLIPSTEISTQSGHVLGLFLKQPIEDAFLRKDRRPTAAEAVAEIHRCGGAAVLAHPFQSAKYDPYQLKTVPFDAIEAANARAAMKNKQANRQAAQLATAWKLSVTGGSDAHSAAEVGSCYTELEVNACTIDALRAALIAGHSKAVFVKTCRWRDKGFSQVRKAARGNSIPAKLKSYLYLAVCFLRDVTR